MFSDPLSPEDRAAVEQFRKSYDAAGRPLPRCDWLPPSFEYGDDGEPLVRARPTPTRVKPVQRTQLPLAMTEPHLSGVPLVYNLRHRRFCGGPTTVRPGAFREAIAARTVDVRIDHGSEPIAFQSNGTLYIVDDAAVLWITVHVANPYVRDLIAAQPMPRGWSVGYERERLEGETLVRAELVEISLCLESGPRADATFVKSNLHVAPRL